MPANPCNKKSILLEVKHEIPKKITPKIPPKIMGLNLLAKPVVSVGIKYKVVVKKV